MSAVAFMLGAVTVLAFMIGITTMILDAAEHKTLVAKADFES
jgi:hypothetical protein